VKKGMVMNMKKLIVDRFEGKFVICEQEDKTIIKLPRYKLPPGCKEGQCIVLNRDGMYQADFDETKKREKQILDKINRLFES
jgi:Protein of unknown function (DUF3006).